MKKKGVLMKQRLLCCRRILTLDGSPPSGEKKTWNEFRGRLQLGEERPKPSRAQTIIRITRVRVEETVREIYWVLASKLNDSSGSMRLPREAEQVARLTNDSREPWKAPGDN